MSEEEPTKTEKWLETPEVKEFFRLMGFNIKFPDDKDCSISKIQYYLTILHLKVMSCLSNRKLSIRLKESGIDISHTTINEMYNRSIDYYNALLPLLLLIHKEIEEKKEELKKKEAENKKKQGKTSVEGEN